MKFTINTLFLMLMTGCMAASVSSVYGAAFTVNTTGDTPDAVAGDGVCADANGSCSLRAAISEANALAGADTITLGSLTYQQIQGAYDEDQNIGGDYDIRSEITINGVSRGTTFVQGTGCVNGPSDRVLDVAAGAKLTLNDLTVSKGCHNRTITAEPGGGILSQGDLVLNNVSVSDNLTQNFEGGGSGVVSGGGLYVANGTLTMNNCVVGNNMSRSSRVGATGGGIGTRTNGAIVINDSTIVGNRVEGANQQTAIGGAMHSSSLANLTINNSHFDGNFTTGLGGGLYILSDVNSSSTANITGTTFNSNANGSGLYLYNTAGQQSILAVNLDRVTINGNSIGSSSGSGAGMKAWALNGDIRIEMRNSTVSNNTAGAAGGGVDLSTVESVGGSEITAYIYNSTFSGNSGKIGGALSATPHLGDVTALFYYCTLTNNTASVRGGAVGDAGNNPGRFYLHQMVAAGNTAPTGPDISATSSVASLDYNHIGVLAGFTMHGNVTHNTFGNPMLDPLAGNGGATLTHMPQAGSPLVDAIPYGEGGCGTSIFKDNRNFGRPIANFCDKGAVERGSTLAAGPWDLSGTVRTAGGVPIRSVLIRVTGDGLPSGGRTTYTGTLGTYNFPDLPGGVYTVTVKSRRYVVSSGSQVLALSSDNLSVDFTADAESAPPPEKVPTLAAPSVKEAAPPVKETALPAKTVLSAVRKITEL